MWMLTGSWGRRKTVEVGWRRPVPLSNRKTPKIPETRKGKDVARRLAIGSARSVRVLDGSLCGKSQGKAPGPFARAGVGRQTGIFCDRLRDGTPRQASIRRSSGGLCALSTNFSRLSPLAIGRFSRLLHRS